MNAETNVRKRTVERYQPGPDYDESLPYGGKVYVARKKKPDPWYIVLIEVLAVALTITLSVGSYFYYDQVHFHLHHFYAHLGYSHAQHVVGQKYLQGHGIEQNHSMAFQWLKKAADQGHPHASYNLAIGHLEGLHSHVKKGEARKLIRHAAKNGVPEAKETYATACHRGDCDA